MQKNQDQITVYSLSLEELALSIGMINQRELSHVLLRTTYPDLTDLQMRSRLISATSSLLAAELATLTKDRTAQLSEALQLAVFPFAVYDRMLRIGILRKGSTDNITIYLQKGKRF